MNGTTTQKFTFGEILSNVRERMGKTQAQFVEFLEIKISRVSISKWELDDAIPSRRRMPKIQAKIRPHLRPEELAALEELIP